MNYRLKHISTGLYLNGIPCPCKKDLNLSNLSKYLDKTGEIFEDKFNKDSFLPRNGINPTVFEWEET